MDLVRVRLRLRAPFVTARSSTATREALLVHLVTTDGEGWGECAAPARPDYSGETIDTARLALRDHLVPRLRAGQPFDGVRGARFAKAALEAAVLDATLRAEGVSLARFLGATRARVPAGVAVGMAADVVEVASAYVETGYRRIKLKIAPWMPEDVVRAVRAAVGDDVALQVDANGSYTLADAARLAAIDDLGLQCIEQPLDPDALLDHVELSRRISTPVCLDETVTSAPVASDALRLGACRVINVKPGRVGGIAEARRVHDAVLANGAAALCGGMLETGIGRAVNVALAALPGFTLPGDLSASDRYFDEDLTEPFVLEDGTLRVPDGPGTGVIVQPDVLARHTIARERL